MPVICQRPEKDESRQYTRFIKENLSQKRGFYLPFVLPLKVMKISLKEGTYIVNDYHIS